MSKVRYASRSQISVVVFLSGTRSMRVRFTPVTGGGSVYYTEDEAVQAALEKHPRYGKMFEKDELWLRNQEAVARKAAQAKERQEKKETQQKEAAETLREMNVPDLGVAKNYLADKFGLARSNLKSKAAVLKAAREHGVIFTGLD